MMTPGQRVRHIARGWIGIIVFVGKQRHMVKWETGDPGKETWCDESWLGTANATSASQPATPEAKQ